MEKSIGRNILDKQEIAEENCGFKKNDSAKRSKQKCKVKNSFAGIFWKTGNCEGNLELCRQLTPGRNFLQENQFLEKNAAGNHFLRKILEGNKCLEKSFKGTNFRRIIQGNQFLEKSYKGNQLLEKLPTSEPI